MTACAASPTAAMSSSEMSIADPGKEIRYFVIVRSSGCECESTYGVVFGAGALLVTSPDRSSASLSEVKRARDTPELPGGAGNAAGAPAIRLAGPPNAKNPPRNCFGLPILAFRGPSHEFRVSFLAFRGPVFQFIQGQNDV